MTIDATLPFAFISALAWAYLLLGHGGFWRIQLPPRGKPLKPARVVAVVPARNEAAVISSSIRSLLAQADVDLTVILIDDNSSDSTAEVARAAVSGWDRLIVIHGTEVPFGWTGKVWAMQQGVVAAQTFSPEYLLFTDADIEHDPDSIASLIAIAEMRNCSLASYMVRLHCETVAEKLLIPAFVFFFFKLYPPRWIADPRLPVAGAAGGCILLKPEALKSIGGLECIRGEIIDDCSLARAVKQTGARLWLGVTDSARSIRPYGTFAEIGRMISRTAFNQLRHSLLFLLIAVVGLLVVYVAPWVAVFSGGVRTCALGVLAVVLMFIAYLPMIRFYRLRPYWALTLPVAAIFYLGATLSSAIRYWSGRGGEWKGRAQDARLHT
ncbi:MAG TPA: glycosyltransferase [Terriglobales bacterium]|nr:glycosyltransferase [Terriglobales bacterium]